MRAVIIVAGCGLPRIPGWFAPLLHSVDRPVLQHIVEFLVDQGIADFHFVLNESPDRIEELFGAGERWGSRFTYHLVQDADHPYSALRVIGNGEHAEPTLIVHADRLPVFPSGLKGNGDSPHRRLFCYQQETDGIIANAWTGWAWIDGVPLDQTPENADEARLERYLADAGLPADTLAVKDLLDFRSFDGALRAQSYLMTKPELNAHLLAQEIETGIWIARNVMLHPKAQLTAPVYVGENSRIEEGAKLGPNAVIGCDCIVDKGTTVEHAAIYPGSYCGQGLALDHVIVDRNRLLDCRLDSQVSVSDSFILSSLKGAHQRHWVRSWVSVAVAAVLLVLTLPIALITALYLRVTRGQVVFKKDKVLRVPASENEAEWKFFTLWSFRDPTRGKRRGLLPWFVLDFIPALPQVVQGHLHLIGVEPRTLKQVKTMPEDWKSLFLKAHIGLITEAFVLHGSAATADQIYSSEVYYSAMADLSHDVALAGRFITRTLTAQHDF